MIQFRNAEIRDINKIVKLEVECMEELKERIGTEFPIFDEKRNNETSLVSIIEGECGVSIIAEENEINGSVKIVGAIIALDKDLKTKEEDDHNTLTIRNMFVDRNYRKQGIAHKLLELTENWANEHKYVEITTFVYTPNIEIQRILNQFGIQQINEGRKKVIDQKKYAELKNQEILDYYNRVKGNLLSRGDQRNTEL